MTPHSDPNAPPPPRRFQFRIMTLLILTAAMSVLAAALGGMFRHRGDGDSLKLRFILVTLIAPLGLLLVIAIARLLRPGRRPRRPKW